MNLEDLKVISFYFLPILLAVLIYLSAKAFRRKYVSALRPTTQPAGMKRISA